MAEQKKKRNPLLDRFKKDMNTKEDLAKLQEKAKQETLAASKNKKLSEPAKQKLKVQKQSDEDQRASAAMKRSRETINALANRGTLKSYGGYSGPAETENKVTNPAKPPAPKPKPKPQATAPKPKPKPKPQAAAPAKPKPKPTKPSGTQGGPMPSNPPGMRQTRGKDLREKDPQSGLYINQSKPSKPTSTPKKGAVKREGGQWKRWDGAKWVVTRSPY